MGLVVAALGGNALLPRGEPFEPERQRRTAEAAAAHLAHVARRHQLVVTHGNGPQVGTLAVKEAAPDKGGFGLDVLDAETEGMIGYVLEQELSNALADHCRVATVLSRVEVDPDDPAFGTPTKPIGRVLTESEGRDLTERFGWTVAPDGAGWRRVVPSPRPARVLALPAIRTLVGAGFLVISGGGGGIPVVNRDGVWSGIATVIDKDLTSAEIAAALHADVLVILTDQPGVWRDFGGRRQALIRRASPEHLATLNLPAGTIGPKVDAAISFVERTGGRAGRHRLPGRCRRGRGGPGRDPGRGRPSPRAVRCLISSRQSVQQTPTAGTNRPRTPPWPPPPTPPTSSGHRSPST